MRFRDHFDRWGWVVALILLSLFVLRMAWGRDAFCATDTEHCGREWFSTLGSWASASVTAATVIYLALQVEEERKNNRISLGIALRNEIEAVEKMSEKLKEIRDSASSAKKIIPRLSSDNEAEIVFTPMFLLASEVNESLNDEFTNSFIARYVLRKAVKTSAYQKRITAKFNRIASMSAYITRDNARHYCDLVLEYFVTVEEFCEPIEGALAEQRQRLDGILTS